MGEIDRIQPVLRPVLGLKPTDRVQPDSDRHHQPQQDRDELDLSNTGPLPDDPAEPEEADTHTPQEHAEGLDISI